MHMRGETARTRRATRLRLALSVVLLACCPLLRWLFAQRGTQFFPWYGALTRRVMAGLATLTSVAPFALWDLCVVALVVLSIVRIALRVHQHRSILPVFAHLLFAVSLSAFLFVAWALNHAAPSLADSLELDVGAATVDELAEATDHYLVRAAELAPQVPRDDQGALVEQDFYELARIAGGSYQGLGERYEIFQGSTAPVKALLVWGEPLLYSGHTGMFWAPTGESGVPLNCADADRPFIMCHEAAHRLGIASEQEANFAACLACAASDDVRFAYSGSYNAFAYCLNALAAQDPERAERLIQDAAASELGEGVAFVLSDRTATAEHYDAYEGFFEKVGSEVNDRYLKSFGESAGVRSYGLVVDYLIAWDKAGQ